MTHGVTRRDRKKELFWRRHTQAQARSGRTIRAYCRVHGISAIQFSWWRREWARRAASPSLPAFVPVTVADASPRESATWLEIVLPNAWRVRVAGGVPRQDLTEVLGAMAAVREGGPC